MSLLLQATLYGCGVLAAFAVSLPQPRGDGKPSLVLSLNAPSTVNGVTDFTVTGKLKNAGTQDVHVVRDPGGILYEFFTADALDIKRTDSKEKDATAPFVGYRASWDMKTYLDNKIQEDEYLPDDHPDVVSLTEDSESESHAKRGNSNSDSVGESDTLSDTDTSITGSSKSGDNTYPPGTTFHLTVGQTISFDYKVGDVYDFSKSGAGAYDFKLKRDYFYVLADDEIYKVDIDVKVLNINIQGELKGEVPKPGDYANDTNDSDNGVDLNSIAKRTKPRVITVETRECGMIQTSTIDLAAQHANRLAKESFQFISKMKTSRPRYTRWFGRWATEAHEPYSWKPRDQVFEMFKSISTTHSFLKSGKDGGYIYDCRCKSTVNAYTLHRGAPPDEDDPAIMYLCRGFRSRNKPMIGSDSKAGTLIHEATHFSYNDRYLPTVDFAYFRADSLKIAREDPYLAVRNADSYALFAENKPRYT